MADNPFLARTERTKNLTKSHKRAPKQEREIASRIGGKPVSGSGCGEVKGDVRKRKVVRIECKTTKHKSFSVTLDMLEKIEEAAASGGELPIIVVEFNDPDTGRKIKDIVVCPSYVLDTIFTMGE